jgi:hypothetical protein
MRCRNISRVQPTIVLYIAGRFWLLGKISKGFFNSSIKGDAQWDLPEAKATGCDGIESTNGPQQNFKQCNTTHLTNPLIIPPHTTYKKIALFHYKKKCFLLVPLIASSLPKIPKYL